MGSCDRSSILVAERGMIILLVYYESTLAQATDDDKIGAIVNTGCDERATRSLRDVRKIITNILISGIGECSTDLSLHLLQGAVALIMQDRIRVGRVHRVDRQPGITAQLALITRQRFIQQQV